MDESKTQEGRTMAKVWDGQVTDCYPAWGGVTRLHIEMAGDVSRDDLPTGRVRIVEVPPPAEYFCWSDVAGDKQWNNPANWRVATADDKPGPGCCVIHRNFLPKANTQDATAEEAEPEKRCPTDTHPPRTPPVCDRLYPCEICGRGIFVEVLMRVEEQDRAIILCDECTADWAHYSGKRVCSEKMCEWVERQKNIKRAERAAMGLTAQKPAERAAV